MDKNKIHGFMDQLNLFFIGAVIGAIIGACFSANVYKGKNNKAEEKVKAYEEYYKCRFWINKACNNFCYFLPENCKFVLNEKSIKHKG